MPTHHAPGDTSDVRKPFGGKPSYGYRWQDKQLVPDPVESPVRTLIYELFAKLRRKKAVARALNDAGYRTRSGSKWTDTTIDRLVRDPTAKGLYRTNYTQKAKGNGPSLTKPEAQWVWTPVEPVVTEELWDECNALLDDKEGLRRRRGRQPVHLFAGVAVCQCGRRMYVPTHSSNYRCSTCSNRIPAEDLEAIFVEQLKGYRLSPETDDAEFQDLHDQWSSFTQDEKRRIIENITKRIVIGQDEIDINFNHFPSATPAEAAETSPQAMGAAEGPQPGRIQPIQSHPAVAASTAEVVANKLDPVTLAVAMMRDHPDWSARKLAKSAGCSHTTLTRSRLFRIAKALANAKTRRPSGWKTADGRVEAVADPDQD